ncbi:hypothetical protein Pcinc_033243 [Petrolisthes cinctipes]|uniref:Uncharacterized protein n=1 Tax=Petrolisthes cinctipes TaxID=88211 RepID=A0AAE1ESP6_PETCI|nr:hypothetical protein Pcinc_033243 [Petrolisthes cinctipes]
MEMKKLERMNERGGETREAASYEEGDLIFSQVGRRLITPQRRLLRRHPLPPALGSPSHSPSGHAASSLLGML